MKRLICISIIILLLSNVVIAEEDHFEGYDGLAWGSSVQDLKDKYPEVLDISNSEMEIYKVQIFKLPIDDFVRSFIFFEGKLYSGRTTYTNIDTLLLVALAEKIKEEYGVVTESGSKKISNGQMVWFGINVTENLSLATQMIVETNDNDGTTQVNLIIDFYNDKVLREVTKLVVEQKKKEIEF